MLILILLLILGSFLVYISRFNFTPVSVNLGWYVMQDVPLFYVMMGCLLFGLILSFLVNMIRAVSNSFAMRDKNKEIKVEKEEILELTKQVHQLELENEKQKKDKSLKPTDTDAL